MVENTLQITFKIEQEIEQEAAEFKSGSMDVTQLQFQQLLRLAEEATLVSVKAAENCGKDAFLKIKDCTEEMII